MQKDAMKDLDEFGLSLNDYWDYSAAKRFFQKQVGEYNEVSLLSSTNNTVWRVKCNSAEYVVKEIKDKTVDVVSEYAFLAQLQNKERFRPIIEYYYDDINQVYVSLYPYIRGDSFDKVVSNDNYSSYLASLWASQIESSFRSIRTQRVEFFGKRISNNTPNYNRWMDFVYDYLENQKNKGPIVASLKYKALMNAFKKYENRIDAEVIKPTLVCGDCNLRNYLIDHDKNLICIHTPMLWHADAALPYGELMVHLDQSRVLSMLEKYASFPKYRLHLYAAFSAYTILVFVERFSGVDLLEAKPWGRSRSLVEIFDEHISFL